MTRKEREQRRKAREWAQNGHNIVGVWALNVILITGIVVMGLLEAGLI